MRVSHSRIQFIQHREEVKMHFKDDAKRGWEGLLIFV